jgi:hypothetical protein
MYNNLYGDSSAQSSDDCKSNCCSDSTCQVWQWSDDPLTPPNCWTGDSDDYGDSGGVEWQGEQGKGGPAPAPGPGPAPGPAPGPGPAPPPPAPGPPAPDPDEGKHGEITAHPGPNWPLIGGLSAGALAVAFVGYKVYGGGSADASGGAMQPMLSQVQCSGGMVGHHPHSSMAMQPGPGWVTMAGPGGVMMAGPVAHSPRSKRKKKRSSARSSAAGEEERIVVIGPDGKKKVKRKVKRSEKGKGPRPRGRSSRGASGSSSRPRVTRPGGAGGGGAASLE